MPTYPPAYHMDNDPEFLARIMRDNSFACVTSIIDGDILATHVPLVFRADSGVNNGTYGGTLYGHFSRINPQAKALDGASPSMAVFNGPHAYISASWYDKPERQVPTWNYISVQAKGSLVKLSDAAAIAEMKILTEIYEPDGAWKISDAQDYTDRLMRGIVYFKMDITDILGVRKMSADKNANEYANVINELEVMGEYATADEMKILNH